jgi:hypothetical protein
LNAIKAIRKECGMIAYSGSSLPTPQKTAVKIKKADQYDTIVSANGVHKYEDIWKQIIPSIIDSLTNKKTIEINIGKAPFAAVGNRKSYSFRLEIQNGSVANNIDGSAVARDLARVLLNHPKFIQAAKSKYLILRLDKQFNFHLLVS